MCFFYVIDSLQCGFSSLSYLNLLILCNHELKSPVIINNVKTTVISSSLVQGSIHIYLEVNIVFFAAVMSHQLLG
jgi:hypothetical protein